MFYDKVIASIVVLRNDTVYGKSKFLNKNKYYLESSLKTI